MSDLGVPRLVASPPHCPFLQDTGSLGVFSLLFALNVTGAPYFLQIPSSASSLALGSIQEAPQMPIWSCYPCFMASVAGRRTPRGLSQPTAPVCHLLTVLSPSCQLVTLLSHSFSCLTLCQSWSTCQLQSSSLHITSSGKPSLVTPQCSHAPYPHVISSDDSSLSSAWPGAQRRVQGPGPAWPCFPSTLQDTSPPCWDIFVLPRE